VLSTPRRWSDVTPEWMSRALAARFPGAVVGDVRTLDAADGTNARARLRLRYRAGRGPQTLLHGDPHPGDTYGLPDGTTGFYDWQLARLGVRHLDRDDAWPLYGAAPSSASPAGCTPCPAAASSPSRPAW
jgi:aminoglycoside phosphotransferase (APT) family kinase protein